MKKSGFTMVELMISIAMIAVVMVFLVRLLVDVKYDSTNEVYNTANQINRSEIIKTIQNDWLDKELFAVNPDDASSISKYSSYYDKKDIVLVATDDTYSVISIVEEDGRQYVKYKSNDDDTFKYKWKVETNNKDTKLQKTNIPFKVLKNTKYDENTKEETVLTNDYIVEINIPMSIGNDELKDSKMDNIVLTFYGSNINDLKNIKYLNAEQ